MHFDFASVIQAQGFFALGDGASFDRKIAAVASCGGVDVSSPIGFAD